MFLFIDVRSWHVIQERKDFRLNSNIGNLVHYGKLFYTNVHKQTLLDFFEPYNYFHKSNQFQIKLPIFTNTQPVNKISAEL